MPAHYYAYLTFLDSMKSFHNNFVNDKENASMAHHLARRTKREKEHPMCGAAPLSPQFGAKVQKKLFSNKFFREKIEGGLPTTPLQRLTRQLRCFNSRRALHVRRTLPVRSTLPALQRLTRQLRCSHLHCSLRASLISPPAYIPFLLPHGDSRMRTGCRSARCPSPCC